VSYYVELVKAIYFFSVLCCCLTDVETLQPRQHASPVSAAMVQHPVLCYTIEAVVPSSRNSIPTHSSSCQLCT